ncbi:16S rRNA (cytosine(1402)-N(4))-methyltransferase [candidate division WOR-3 bacterium 4484_100]|uniref:Ribosomal RNA small subunit methyltransferase H n=1 Tax=candidate division WOR-3 bacterium 4484_100 TaxID=1936077 RepID=A0A1V4QHY2_UNCW3|nr:MAG: 16S rRNA (cytosine(1402)-N(4))-methyltransferase [candidate division WOR-3 bacterium 4484_100]
MVFHQPVLVAEVIEWMNLRPSGVYCDCTVGGAGHLMALLKANRKAYFIGLDWDAEAIAFSKKRLSPFKDRCVLFQENFTNLGFILKRLKLPGIDGALFDLGVSYHQLTTPERGFSFERNGPLLMNMAPNTPPLFKKLRQVKMDELKRILKIYGDVRNSRSLAREIYEHRGHLETTGQLRELVAKKIPRRFLKKNLHKVFQALRIWTNDELTNLISGLRVAFENLKPGGRILIIAYHSGEDRLVKNFLRQLSLLKKLKILNKKVIRPAESEIKKNPQARSARLRVGEKCASF